jgi:4-hydroxybenzoate polyprenyltransferase
MIGALVRLARPHQWVKNGFVFVGWIFSHRWGDTALLGHVLTMFAAFCLASSAVYAANDVVDRAADAGHPKKRHRPVASGALTPGAAAAFSAVLLVAGLALAATVSGWGLAMVLAYVALNAGYSAGLKHVAVLDVFIIATGFMLRILAGTLAVDVPPSQWLLLCGMMVTLFLGFAKRRSELVLLGRESGKHRAALDDYTPALLDSMITVSAAGVMVTYSLYTVNPATVALHGTDRLILTLPFVLYGMFRYLFLLHRRGAGSDPAGDLLQDFHLIGAVAGWVVVTAWLLAPSL